METACHMTILVPQDLDLKGKCEGACSVFQSLLNIGSLLKVL